MSGPLEGIRVIELAVIHVGPPIGYMMGDLGAEVVKIERPDGGDPVRSSGKFWFEAVNRSKKSLGLDLKQDEGKEILHKLVSKSDVFITNFPQSLLQRLGADYKTLRPLNTGLVYGSVGAYGPEGEDRNRRAFEPLVQARTGFTSIVSGGVDADPVLLEGGLFDQTAGTVMTYGILSALVHRQRTGQGQMVEGSLLGSAIHFQHGAVNYASWADQSADLALPPGEGSPLFTRKGRAGTDNLLYNSYRCADGRWILFCEPNQQRWWKEFCDAIGVSKLANDVPEPTSADKTMSILDDIFSQKTLAQWLQILKDANLNMGYSAINSPQELTSDPQAASNNYIMNLDHPTRGKIKVAGVPFRFSETPISKLSAAPELGQDSEKVVTDIAGLSTEEYTLLKNKGVVV